MHVSALVAAAVLARFGDRQGLHVPIDPLVCHVTVQGTKQGRLGNDLYRYVSGAGVARKLGCRFCAPVPLVARLRDVGFDVVYRPCPKTIDWTDVRESRPWMLPQWSKWARVVNLRLLGYLQSHHYHHGKAPIGFSASTQATCDKMVRGACPRGADVSMHARGGDAIPTGVGPHRDHYTGYTGCVVAVSDEPKWVKANMPATVHYLRGTPAVDMCIAGSGKKQVLSGGTFDFFAAYFAKHQDVHMDRRGFRWDLPGTSERDLASFAPSCWVRRCKTSTRPQLSVVAVVSLELLSMANNWIRSLLPYKLPIIIYGIDQGVCGEIIKAARCIEPSGARQVPNAATEKARDVVYQGANYLRNTNRKLPLFVDALGEAAPGSWVLFSDVDIVFLKSPYSYLKGAEATVNFMFQQALTTCNDSPGPTVVKTPELVCTGLYYVRAVPEARAVLRKAIGSPSFDHTDQGAVNYILRESQVPIQLLPCTAFPNGFIFQHSPPPDPVAVHFNYIAKASDKEALMRKRHMWLPTTTTTDGENALPATFRAPDTIVTAYYHTRSKHPHGIGNAYLLSVDKTSIRTLESVALLRKLHLDVVIQDGRCTPNKTALQQTWCNKKAFYAAMRRCLASEPDACYFFEDDIKLTPGAVQPLSMAPGGLFKYLGICLHDEAFGCGRCAHAMSFSKAGIRSFMEFDGKHGTAEPYLDVMVEKWCVANKGFPVLHGELAAPGEPTWRGAFYQDRAKFPSIISGQTRISSSPGKSAHARVSNMLATLFTANVLASTNMPLHDVMYASGSDKGTHHHYDRYYAPIMEPLQDAPIRLLEIGVERGKSMELWDNYFVHGTLFGIGYHNHQTKQQETSGKRTTLYMGDQSNVPWMKWMIKDSGGNFDIVIDDGSHIPSHQRISFDVLWPHVKPGGHYFIEDVETSYWGKGQSIYGYTLNGSDNIVDEWTHLIDSTVNREFTTLTATYPDVESITFGQNIIIIRKAFDASILSRIYRFRGFLDPK